MLGLTCFFLYFVFCVSVNVKLTVPLLCVCVHSAWKGRFRNDLYCVGRDVKPYSLTQKSKVDKLSNGLYMKPIRLKRDAFTCVGRRACNTVMAGDAP